MPQSIPPELTREHVLRAMADLDAGVEHPFGQPTGYEVEHDGKRYAPKAVVGLAFRYVRGSILRPDEFSGGEAHGQANFVLRQLGFTVVKKGDKSKDDENQTGKDWSEQEVRLIIADYFDMLHKELHGKPYSKAEYRRALMKHLDGRSESSIEYKHQNISAVLVGLGLPYINGYKPASNFQQLLAHEVESYLDRTPSFLQQLVGAPLLNPITLPKVESYSLDQIIDAPPDRIFVPKQPSSPWISRKPKRIDFVEREAANRQLGKLGEQFVVGLERQRLVGLGRDDLAGKVEWVAETVGDGLGYDVLSFDEKDESMKLVEVKTSVQGKYFPFYVTETEVRCSEEMAKQFYLYRVFDFAVSPRLYVLTGSLREACRLAPTLYRASF